MKMDEHARAWAHEFVAGILSTTNLPPEQRNSLHWEILNHLHEATERRVAGRGGPQVTLADVQAVVAEMGGTDGIASAFLQTRVAATPRAGFGKRLGAFVIDVVLAWFTIGFLWAMSGTLPLSTIRDLARMGGFPGFFPFFALALFYAYLAFTEFKFGATVGKMAFKLRTVMTDGRPLTAEAALIRNIAKAIPPLLFIDALLYLIAFLRDDQRASDRLADTIVIDSTRAVWAPAPVVPTPSAFGPPSGAGQDPATFDRRP